MGKMDNLSKMWFNFWNTLMFRERSIFEYLILINFGQIALKPQPWTGNQHPKTDIAPLTWGKPNPRTVFTGYDMSV